MSIVQNWPSAAAAGFVVVGGQKDDHFCRPLDLSACATLFGGTPDEHHIPAAAQHHVRPKPQQPHHNNHTTPPPHTPPAIMLKIFRSSMALLLALAATTAAFDHEFVMQFTGDCSSTRDTCQGNGPSQVARCFSTTASSDADVWTALWW